MPQNLTCFVPPLERIAQLLRQRREHRGREKIYALHAPEVECIGKGNGDAINVILAAAGHNLRLLRAWLIRFLAFLLSLLAINARAPAPPSAQLAAR